MKESEKPSRRETFTAREATGTPLKTIDEHVAAFRVFAEKMHAEGKRALLSYFWRTAEGPLESIAIVTQHTKASDALVLARELAFKAMASGDVTRDQIRTLVCELKLRAERLP